MRRILVAAVIAAACCGVALGQSCTTEVLFASPGAGNVPQQVIGGWIDGSRETVEIAVDVFIADRLGDAVIRAYRRGVAVRVLLAVGSVGMPGGEDVKLVSAGVSVRISAIGQPFAHRFAVIDGRVALSGSSAWADAAASGVLGNLVQIVCESAADGPVQGYLVEFERLWADAVEVESLVASPVSVLSSIAIASVDPTAQCIYLLNTSEEPIDVSGWSLGDLEGWYVFPDGTEIVPNDPYRICIDLFNPDGDIDLFYLAAHDEVFLSTPEGAIVDEVVW